MVQVILHCRTWFQVWFKQFLNFEPDFGQVHQGSGSNFGSGPNRGITTYNFEWWRHNPNTITFWQTSIDGDITLNRYTIIHNSNFTQFSQFSRIWYGACVVGLGTILEYRHAISTDHDEHILHCISISTYILKLLLLIVVINPGCRHDLWYILIIFNLIDIYCLRPWLRPKQSQSQLSLTALAWPPHFESPSHQSQAKAAAFRPSWAGTSLFLVYVAWCILTNMTQHCYHHL